MGGGPSRPHADPGLGSVLQRTPAVYCVRLARALVDDYCSLGPGSVQTLRHIFSASPRFCCQFITAVAMLYDLSSGTVLSARATAAHIHPSCMLHRVLAPRVPAGPNARAWLGHCNWPADSWARAGVIHLAHDPRAPSEDPNCCNEGLWAPTRVGTLRWLSSRLFWLIKVFVFLLLH